MRKGPALVVETSPACNRAFPVKEPGMHCFCHLIDRIGLERVLSFLKSLSCTLLYRDKGANLPRVPGPAPLIGPASSVIRQVYAIHRVKYVGCLSEHFHKSS